MGLKKTIQIMILNENTMKIGEIYYDDKNILLWDKIFQGQEKLSKYLIFARLTKNWSPISEQKWEIKIIL